MADSKVSSLPSATAVNASDSLYLVQGGVSKKITPTTLFANIPGILRAVGPLHLGGTPQALLNSGTVNTVTSVTEVTTEQVSTANIADGALNGQLKVIVMVDWAGNFVLTSSNMIDTLTFDRVGASGILIWLGTYWYTLSATATIS